MSAAILFCSVLLTQAQSRVTVTWDRNSEADITGYRLHCGTATRVYTDVINVGNVTTASVSNLSPGVTYRFAVTALNTAGLESDYSSEIAFTTTNIVTPNIPPTLAALSNLTINEDAGAQTVLLTGISPGPENQTVTITASAAPPSLIPSVQTVYVSPRTTGTVSFATAPNAWGTGVVNVTVSDGLAQIVRSFAVTVNPVNDTPTLTSMADRAIDQNTATGPIPFTVGDAETSAANLTLLGTSSDQALVPNASIVFGGSGSSRTVNVTPATGQTGAATISITVSDGVHTATDAWVLTVRSTTATNTPPALSAVRSTTIFSGGSSLPIRFSVSDAETPTEALQVWTVSSNPSLIPAGNIAFQGSGSDRTLTVRAANAVGSATITLSVNDGSGNTRSTNFGVSVVARPAQLVYLPFEAEEGSIVAPMQLYTDSSATYVATTSSEQGTVSFQVSVEQPGNYIIWARHLSPDTGRDSFFVSVDGVEIRYATAMGTWSPNWQWTRVTVPDSASTQDPRVLSLSAGAHTVTFRGSEPSCGLDRIIICNDLEFIPGVGGNTAPSLSSFSARTIDEDTSTGPIAFTVSDAETPGSLVINTASSNPSLVPAANMTIGGTGTNRTLTVTPALNQSGTATITVSVSDGQLSASSSFLLTVNALNDAPTLSSIANSTTVEDAAAAIAFTVGDAETSAGSLALSGTSSDQALVPNANIVFGGSGGSRTVRITPAANQFGTASINVSVSDGSLSATRTFQLTVMSSNDPPTVASIPNSTTVEDTPTSPIAFTIGDVETAPTGLIIGGASSDQALVPNGNIVFGGSGANRTVRVTPAANQFGTASINVMVNDGAVSSIRTFQVTVVSSNDPPTMGALLPATAVPGTLTVLQPVVIGDIDTAASSLVVTGTSSDTAVLPNANITIGTLGAIRTLSVRPLQTGSATVTLRVSDGLAQSTQSFLLTATNAAGQFALRPSFNLTNGGFRITWDSRIGYTYRVLTKTSLTQTSWVPLSNIRATNTTTSWIDLAGGQQGMSVYKIEMTAPIGFEN